MYLHRPHIAEAFLAPYLLVELVGCEEGVRVADEEGEDAICLLYTSPSPRDRG